jgi:hypothetical protein
MTTTGCVPAGEAGRFPPGPLAHGCCADGHPAHPGLSAGRNSPSTRRTTTAAAPAATSVTTPSCTSSSIIRIRYATPAARSPWYSRRAATYATLDM